MITYLLAYYDALGDVCVCWLLLTRDDGSAAREDGRVLGRVLRSSETGDEEIEIRRGGFSRSLLIWLHSGAYFGLELKALPLELLEVREILGVDTLEAFYCLLDIIGKALDVPI